MNYVTIEQEVNEMRRLLQRFMYGRYGIDSFSNFLLGASLVCCILGALLNSVLLNLVFWILMIYVYFRMFSKNHQKRYQENIKFLETKNKFLKKIRSEKAIMKQKKTHHIYKCPTCRQKIRIPKGKGRICITCPKCKTEFTKIS